MKIGSGFDSSYLVGQYGATNASASTSASSQTSSSFQSALSGTQSAAGSAPSADKVSLSAQGKAASAADSAGGDAAAKATKKLDAAAKALEELFTYAKKTPAQLMREKILKQMGLTEDDLKKMPPEKQMAIEKTIADKIKEMLENPEVAKATDGPQNPFSSQSSAPQSVQSTPAGQLSQPAGRSAGLAGAG